MTILVTGSLAIDRIMVFPDRFRNHILPDKLHVLNVGFHVPTLKQSFGGTAGNIAYGLRLLGQDPLLLATAGSDFAPYAARLDALGVRRDAIRVFQDVHTAQAFIVTDLDDNQIVAFHPGAMERAAEAPVAAVDEAIDLAIVSPNDKGAMLAHARELRRRGIPTAIDPGQQLPVFTGPELLELLDGAAIYIANDYEWSLTLERCGEDEDAIAARVGAVVVTRGGEGSTIREGERRLEIPPVKTERVVDPTGCGDAYRAGLLYGRLAGLPFEVAGRIGSVMGALAVEVEGTQAVQVDLEGVRRRYAAVFGASF